MQSRRMSGSTSSQSSIGKGRQFKCDKGQDHTRDPPTSRCQGCNSDNHQREDCKFKTHPEFNERGQWDGCLADRALRRWQKDERDIKLIWGKRADGTLLPCRVPDAAVSAAPPRQNADDRDPQRRRDNDRRDRDYDRRDQEGRGGRDGRGQVQWDKDKGTPCLTSMITHTQAFKGEAERDSEAN